MHLQVEPLPVPALESFYPRQVDRSALQEQDAEAMLAGASHERGKIVLRV